MKHPGRIFQFGEIGRAKVRQLCGKFLHPELTPLQQQALTPSRGADPHTARVFRVSADFDKATAGKGGDDAAHRWWLYLLCGGKPA